MVDAAFLCVFLLYLLPRCHLSQIYLLLNLYSEVLGYDHKCVYIAVQ